MKNFFNKKISIKSVLVIIFIVSAVIYCIAYMIAINKFNSVVSYTHEKQKMYSILSEVDFAVRDNCILELNEKNIIDGLCNGYVNSFKDENCKLFTKSEYSKYEKFRKNLSSDIQYEFLDNGILYINCICFGSNSSNDFIDLIKTAVSKKTNNIILDLRNCQNGLEDEIFKILEYLIGEENIVTAINKCGEKEVVCSSKSKNNFNFKIAVLINGNTSGIEEIFASAVKDCVNSKLIGTITAGKAVHKKLIDISNGNILLIPDAYYVTKSNFKILNKGLSPDIMINLTDEKEELLKNQKLSKDNDEQFNKAVDFFDN